MKKFFQSLSAVLFGLAVALLLSEWVLATFCLVDTPPGLFRSSPSRAFEHKPFFKGRDRLANPIRINSKGLRDREYAVPKPAGTFRVLVLGDSVAFGDGVKGEDTFVKKMEKILNEQHPKKPIEVLNAGVRGYNTFQELQLLKEAGFYYEPDLIVVAYVLNDAEPLEKQSGLIDPKHRGMLQIKQYAKEHFYLYAFFRRILELTRHRVTPKQFIESYDDEFGESHPGWKTSKESLRQIHEAASAYHAKMLLVVFPRLEKLSDADRDSVPQQIYRQVIQAADELGVPVFGLLPGLAVYDPEQLKLSKQDVFHPSVFGHEIAAKSLAGFLEKKYFSDDNH